MGGYAEMKQVILILFLFSYTGIFARIIHVGPGHIFKNVTSGVAAAQTGDTVMVDAGHYKEKNLVINKAIVLAGINFPVLDGERMYEIISVKADNVVISGFRIVQSGISSREDLCGIKIYDRKNVVIKNNILEETFFGIYIQNGVNCTIENNKLKASREEEQQSGNGIHCWKSDSMRIIGNTITGHRDGIYFEFVTNSIIWRNTSVKNLRYGLHFMFSNNDAYICNIFKSNGAGVAVMFSHSVKMFHNFFEENWGDGSYGLLLKEIRDSYIENNLFRKNTIGIYMEGASRISLEKNEFKSNGWAMKIQASCIDVTVVKNNFMMNTFDVGTSGTLVLNTFLNNYWDKYDGYDLDKNKLGDIPYRPVSLYAMIIEQSPPAMILFRSFMTSLLDKTERILPTLTPANLKDDYPLMKPMSL